MVHPQSRVELGAIIIFIETIYQSEMDLLLNLKSQFDSIQGQGQGKRERLPCNCVYHDDDDQQYNVCLEKIWWMMMMTTGIFG